MKRVPGPKLIVFILFIVLYAVGASVAGCQKAPTATPTPTKTPTEVPPLATATPMPTATLTPTKTPTPTATASVESALAATATPEPTQAITPTPVLVEMAADINPLTGLKTDPAKLNRRPLAIKIPNAPAAARPQSGLSLADVVLEYEAEANLTRFTAIFLGEDATLLGPVRSMRIPDSEVVPIFKAALVASGGHPAVKMRMTEGKSWADGYKRIICPEDPFLGDGGALKRISGKKPLFELTMYSDTSSLWNVLAQRGVNEQQDFDHMFVFSQEPPAGGSEATRLKIVYKPTFAELEYQYDAETKTYKRTDMGQPLIDELVDEQIAPENVVVLFVNHVDTDIAADKHDPKHIWYAISIQLWGQGPAKIFRDGKVYDATWIRENPQQENDRLIFIDGNGNQVPFRPGQTWIQLVRLDGRVIIE